MTQQTFSFGRNWQEFLKYFDDDRLRIAEGSLIDFLKVENLKGKTFLDIGCGSGLFSLAAFNLGAERILSFDVDPFSVDCCKQLRSTVKNPANWEVIEASILDKSFVAGLGSFDVVYSWGVLHHTGRMWEAIENSGSLVAPGGSYYIALYNKILSRNGNTARIHDFWLWVKKTHNTYPRIGKYFLELPAMAAYVLMVLAKMENPVTHIKNYRSHRGMSWRTDAVDWIAGFPYEFASVEEVFKFVTGKFPALFLTNLKVTSGRGLNWYLFQNFRS